MRTTNNEPQIVCPKCGTAIKLTESLAAPLIAKTRKQFEQKLADKEAEYGQREASLRRSQKALAKARVAIDDEVTRRLQDARAEIAETEAQKARLALATDLDQRDRHLAELKRHLDANNAKLAEAQKAQADVLRKVRELDDAKREVELSVEKKVQQSLTAVRASARAEAEDALMAKVAEKEAQIYGMQRQIEELRRKADQGSQQLQGEVLELRLETLLRERFPNDLIEPVPKGDFGGDILHRVINPAGVRCGTILWESKQTKAWNENWLRKLRDDQRAANAEIALLVSHTLPKNIENFDLIDNIWVTKLRFAVPLATALRQTLIDVASHRQAAAGQRTKIELVYQYLTGPGFRHRIEAIVEAFSAMQDDLERERKALTRSWAKREQQLKAVLISTAGLYGDLQGIAGRTLPQIESFDIMMIEDDASTSID